jgi:anaphase-promoting complex subunit 2
MTIREVVGVLESGVSAVRRAVMFWVLHGVLKEVAPDTFAVLEEAETSTPNQSSPSPCPTRLTLDIPASLASAPSNVQSAEEQQESEMQMYWYEPLGDWADRRVFIVGMLTNLGVLPLERIHSMLSMFVPPPNAYNRTEEELRNFLAEEVRKGKLEFVKGEGGGYKLIQQ